MLSQPSSQHIKIPIKTLNRKENKFITDSNSKTLKLPRKLNELYTITNLQKNFLKGEKKIRKETNQPKNRDISNVNEAQDCRRKTRRKRIIIR